jgi:RsiW-degrading membrane proteinase PrsW (M82 family)
LLFTLRWLLFAALPAAAFGALLWRIVRSGRRSEATAWVVGTFALGGVTAALATFVTSRAESLTSLDVTVSTAGPSGALVFALFVLAPVHEAATVAAVWPAFLSHHLEDAIDGLAYAAAAALGFSVVEVAAVLREHPEGAVWVARALLTVPANVFLACVWGYALGRAKRARRGPPIFPLAFLLAVAVHGVYAHFAYGRGPGALLVVGPLLAAMGVVAWLVMRDLRSHVPPPSVVPSSRLSRTRRPPSMSAVRAALRRADEPIRMHWIALGALVNLGAMIAGVVVAVVAAHLLRVDLSRVDEQDVTAAAPALLLVAGLLASFPASGWLISRAASVHSLLEPALATVLALAITLVTLGIVAPFTVVFAIALSPVAWVLACAGAWFGLEM